MPARLCWYMRLCITPRAQLLRSASGQQHAPATAWQRHRNKHNACRVLRSSILLDKLLFAQQPSSNSSPAALAWRSAPSVLGSRNTRCAATKASKKPVQYVCTGCGNDSFQYFGKCPECGEYNSCAAFLQHRNSPRDGRKTPILQPSIYLCVQPLVPQPAPDDKNVVYTACPHTSDRSCSHTRHPDCSCSTCRGTVQVQRDAACALEQWGCRQQQPCSLTRCRAASCTTGSPFRVATGV